MDGALPLQTLRSCPAIMCLVRYRNLVSLSLFVLFLLQRKDTFTSLSVKKNRRSGQLADLSLQFSPESLCYYHQPAPKTSGD